MDPPGLLSPCACIKLVFMVVYLLASACCSETDRNCACTDIPLWPQTQLATTGCFHSGDTFRYKCIDGYLRKAGTSNLIRCDQDKWSKPSLQCIVNPLDPPQTTPEKISTTFLTSPATPSSGHVSTMSSESEYPELNSTILPPQHTPEASLETSALPQTSSNTPSTSPVSTSASITPERFHSTSSPTTTHRPRRLDRTTPPSSSSFNSTSSTLGTDGPTKGPRRLDRTTPPSSSSFNSTSSTLGTDGPTKGPRRLDRTTPPSSSSFNSTSSTLGTDAVATKVIAPVAIGIIVLAVIGAVWFLYRRKSRKSPRRNGCERPISLEECVPMQQTGDMT